MGKFIEDRFEAEFLIDKTIDEVWASLERQKGPDPTWLTVWPRMSGDSTGEVIETSKPHHVRVHKHSEPCAGSEIAVSLTSEENGTRVLVVQSGFPAWAKDALESFTIGGNQIVADLALYLERGIELSRHSMPWAFSGISAREVQTGLEVTGVMPGTFAERSGLQPGDILLTLGGAPVLTHLELQTVMRVFRTGQNLDATWVRGTQQQGGSASL
jgi:hypothetical protein